MRRRSRPRTVLTQGLFDLLAAVSLMMFVAAGLVAAALVVWEKAKRRRACACAERALDRLAEQVTLRVVAGEAAGWAPDRYQRLTEDARCAHTWGSPQRLVWRERLLDEARGAPQRARPVGDAEAIPAGHPPVAFGAPRALNSSRVSHPDLPGCVFWPSRDDDAVVAIAVVLVAAVPGMTSQPRSLVSVRPPHVGRQRTTRYPRPTLGLALWGLTRRRTLLSSR